MKNLYVTQCGSEVCAPGHSYGPAVRDCHLIHIVASGEGQFTARGETHTLSAGQGFIIFPGEVTAYQADFDRPWSYAWIGYAGSGADEITREAGLSEGERVFDVRDAGKLVDIIVCVRSEAAEMRMSEMSALGGLYRFMAEIGEGRIATDDASSSAYFRKAAWFIEGNLHNGVSVDETARFIGLCRSQLFRVFRTETGVSPRSWISRARLKRAVALLKGGGLSLNEVAISVGYAGGEEMCHAFSRAGLSTPASYRDEPRNDTRPGVGC